MWFQKCFRAMKCLLHFWALFKTVAINLSMLSLSVCSWNGVNEKYALKQVIWKRKNIAVISYFRLSFLVIWGCYPGTHWYESGQCLTTIISARINWFLHADYLFSLVFDLQIWSILKQPAAQNHGKYFWQILFSPVFLKDLFTSPIDVYLLPTV